MAAESTKNNVYARRLQSVREKFSDWEVDCIVLESASNRFWLSGFSGSSGWLLVSKDEAILGTDSRYWLQAESQAPNFRLKRFQGDPEVYLADFVAEAGSGPIGIESQHISLKQFRQLQKIAEVQWVQLVDSLESLRRIKTEQEIETIKLAASITDETMAMVNELACPGMTEKALAWQLEKIMRESGASGLAFPVIVASGPNSARPHHEPGDRQLAIGDSIIIDMGAKSDGYCSDLTRSFFLGDQFSDWFSEIYYTTLASQENVLKKMKGGMSGAEIDSIAREVIVDAGYGNEFRHALGHGVGIDIHETPHLSPRAPDEGLKAGTVVTVEPGIYIENRGGVRIEDLVVLTTEGTKSLSQCPKIPLIPA